MTQGARLHPKQAAELGSIVRVALGLLSSRIHVQGVMESSSMVKENQ